MGLGFKPWLATGVGVSTGGSTVGYYNWQVALSAIMNNGTEVPIVTQSTGAWNHFYLAIPAGASPTLIVNATINPTFGAQATGGTYIPLSSGFSASDLQSALSPIFGAGKVSVSGPFAPDSIYQWNPPAGAYADGYCWMPFSWAINYSRTTVNSYQVYKISIDKSTSIPLNNDGLFSFLGAASNKVCIVGTLGSLFYIDMSHIMNGITATTANDNAIRLYLLNTDLYGGIIKGGNTYSWSAGPLYNNGYLTSIMSSLQSAYGASNYDLLMSDMKVNIFTDYFNYNYGFGLTGKNPTNKAIQGLSDLYDSNDILLGYGNLIGVDPNDISNGGYLSTSDPTQPPIIYNRNCMEPCKFSAGVSLYASSCYINGYQFAGWDLVDIDSMLDTNNVNRLHAVVTTDTGAVWDSESPGTITGAITPLSVLDSSSTAFYQQGYTAGDTSNWPWFFNTRPVPPICLIGISLNAIPTSTVTHPKPGLLNLGSYARDMLRRPNSTYDTGTANVEGVWPIGSGFSSPVNLGAGTHPSIIRDRDRNTVVSTSGSSIQCQRFNAAQFEAALSSVTIGSGFDGSADAMQTPSMIGCAYAAGSNINAASIKIARSTDGGANWSVLTTLPDTIDVERAGPPRFNYNQYNGRCYVIYVTDQYDTSGNVTGNTVLCRHSSDNGATWSAAATIVSYAGSTYQYNRPLITTCQPFTFLAIAYTTMSTSLVTSWLLYKSSDGTTWTYITTLPAITEAPSLGCWPDTGRLLWGTSHHSDDGGNTWV